MVCKSPYAPLVMEIFYGLATLPPHLAVNIYTYSLRPRIVSVRGVQIAFSENGYRLLCPTTVMLYLEGNFACSHYSIRGRHEKCSVSLSLFQTDIGKMFIQVRFPVNVATTCLRSSCDAKRGCFHPNEIDLHFPRWCQEAKKLKKTKSSPCYLKSHDD